MVYRVDAEPGLLSLRPREVSRLARLENEAVDRRFRAEYDEYCTSEHDLFGSVVPAAVRPHQETFHLQDNLGAGERLLVAAEMIEAAAVRWPMDARKRERVAVEARRYSACGDMGLGFTCSCCASRYYVPQHCRSRICEACSARYAKKLEKKIAAVVRETMATRRRGYCFSLLTLTVTSRRFGYALPDRDAIVRLYRETSSFLRLFFGKYQGKRTKSGKIRENRRRPIGAGWLAALELGSDNNNAHCHALVYGPIRLWHRLRSEWEAITGDSSGVDIRALHGGPGGAEQAVRYVLKYIGKPPVTDSYHRIADYALMLKGTRRLRSGGVFFNRFSERQDRDCDFSCPVCGSRLLSDGDLDLRSENAMRFRLSYHQAIKESRKNFPTAPAPVLSAPVSVLPAQLSAF